MATNTERNIGFRINFPTLGYRNFENSGTVQYVSNRANLLFVGANYQIGDTLPFDVGGTSYSPTAIRQLELYWNQGWLIPLV